LCAYVHSGARPVRGRPARARARHRPRRSPRLPGQVVRRSPVRPAVL